MVLRAVSANMATLGPEANIGKPNKINLFQKKRCARHKRNVLDKSEVRTTS